MSCYRIYHFRRSWTYRCYCLCSCRQLRPSCVPYCLSHQSCPPGLVQKLGHFRLTLHFECHFGLTAALPATHQPWALSNGAFVSLQNCMATLSGSFSLALLIPGLVCLFFVPCPYHVDVCPHKQDHLVLSCICKAVHCPCHLGPSALPS